MSTSKRSLIASAGSCLAALLLAGSAIAADAAAPAASAPPSAGAAAPRGPGPGPGPGAAPRGGGGFAADPRAQQRTYHFADASQDMPYCVYASSKVSRDKAAPLIVSLHGMGAPPSIMCNTTAIDLAEEGGYVLVAPMGYSTTGWYGSPVINMGPPGARGPGPGPGAGPGGAPRPGAGPGAAPAPGAGAPPGAPPAGARPPGPPPAAAAANAGPAPTNAQIEKWSEQDVMNVLEMVRKEFNIDPKRIYLTGHSMGGAGTLFLGAKHANLWAAIAPVAPASFMMNDTRAQILGKLKDAGVPVLLLTGDADEVVPPANTRLWAETLKEIGAPHEYVEQPGITHGPVITTSQKEIYAFFARHAKK